jgi:hypothetical protein
MTPKQHLELYEELKPVIFTRVGSDTLTEAQRYFVESFEFACFDDNFLVSYSNLVDSKPDISVRNLHAFCLGYALAGSLNLFKNDNTTNH